MYKATGKYGLNKVIDVADYYLCEIYDGLWGKRIYQMSMKIHSQKRHFKWHESIAYQLASFLPPSPIGVRNQISRILMGSTRRRIKMLEKKLFGSNELGRWK